jgi:hypothetical protein
MVREMVRLAQTLNAMSRKRRFLITSLIALISSLSLALATYLAPAHAEERKYQLEQERMSQQVHEHAMPIARGR